jgi:iron transport multicopper oxidase
MCSYRHGSSWLTYVVILGILLCSYTTSAKDVVYDFNITYVTANPDGLFERQVIGINNQWPIPEIHVTKGDRLIVNVQNHLEDQPTALHWHGLFLEGTTYMDGPTQVTQCEVGPGGSFTYNFTINQPGT